MTKICTIEVSLLPEANKLPNEKLRREIQRELKKHLYFIPYAKELVRVKVQKPQVVTR